MQQFCHSSFCPGPCPSIVAICSSLNTLQYAEHVASKIGGSYQKQFLDACQRCRTHLNQHHQVDLSQGTAKALGQYRAEFESEFRDANYKWLFGAGAPISWWLSALIRQGCKKLILLHESDHKDKIDNINRLFEEVEPYLSSLAFGDNPIEIPQGAKFLEIMIYILRGDSPSNVSYLVNQLHPDNESKRALQVWLRDPKMGLPACLAILKSIS